MATARSGIGYANSDAPQALDVDAPWAERAIVQPILQVLQQMSGDKFAEPLHVGSDPVERCREGLGFASVEPGEHPTAHERGDRDVELTGQGLDRVEDPAPTATRVAAWLTARHVGYAISGDVAADLLAPWARPTRGLVYVEQALDLTPLGLTPAPPDAATLELVVPDDPFVLRDARLLPSDLVTAHPWRVWADTVARGNTDAADALRSHLLGTRTT